MFFQHLLGVLKCRTLERNVLICDHHMAKRVTPAFTITTQAAHAQQSQEIPVARLRRYDNPTSARGVLAPHSVIHNTGAHLDWSGRFKPEAGHLHADTTYPYYQ
jgi:hypothetical protein